MSDSMATGAERNDSAALVKAAKVAKQGAKVVTISPRLRTLGLDEVCEATGQARSTIYQWIADGKFPAPLKPGKRNRWREAALVLWMDREDPNRGTPWDSTKV